MAGRPQRVAPGSQGPLAVHPGDGRSEVTSGAEMSHATVELGPSPLARFHSGLLGTN